MDSEGNGTGMLSKSSEDGIRTGPDKLREMERIMKNHSSSEAIVTVYVGDSNTDLPCLLHVDIGIIIGEGTSILETCQRVGINVEFEPSLREIVRTGKRKGDRLRLYHFKRWWDVIASGLLE